MWKHIPNVDQAHLDRNISCPRLGLHAGPNLQRPESVVCIQSWSLHLHYLSPLSKPAIVHHHTFQLDLRCLARGHPQNILARHESCIVMRRCRREQRPIIKALDNCWLYMYSNHSAYNLIFRLLHQDDTAGRWNIGPVLVLWQIGLLKNATRDLITV